MTSGENRGACGPDVVDGINKVYLRHQHVMRSRDSLTFNEIVNLEPLSLRRNLRRNMRWELLSIKTPHYYVFYCRWLLNGSNAATNQKLTYCLMVRQFANKYAPFSRKRRARESRGAAGEVKIFDPGLGFRLDKWIWVPGMLKLSF